jgi:hypothetical protein
MRCEGAPLDSDEGAKGNQLLEVALHNSASRRASHRHSPHAPRGHGRVFPANHHRVGRLLPSHLVHV